MSERISSTISAVVERSDYHSGDDLVYKADLLNNKALYRPLIVTDVPQTAGWTPVK